VKVIHGFNLAADVTILDPGEPPIPSPTRKAPVLSELEQILSRSRASEHFKNAVRDFCETGGAEHIRVEGSAPQIKVRRLLAHILSTESHLPIERVSLRGRSGCSDFVGTVKVQTTSDTHVYEFVWDCRWRAEQEGWTDCFGFPDQIRAAREYDWRCFAQWNPVAN